MQRKYLINVAIAVLVLTGCKTTYHYAEFIKPSEVYVPSRIYVVGVLDRAANPELSTTILTGGVPFESVKGMPAQAAAKTIKSLKADGEKLSRFKMIDMDWDNTNRNETDFLLKALTSSEIDSLCEVFKVDGIIALEGVEMVVRTQGQVNVVSVVDDSGVPVRVPEFSNEQEVTFTAGWRFYDGYELKVIDEYQETYQRTFNRVAYSPESASEIDTDELNLTDVVYVASQDYLNRISPHWEEDYRLYYRGGSSELYTISQNIDYNGDWEAAAASWLKLTTSEDEKVKYYAMYNMAVASEMLARPRVAKDWLLKAIELRDTKQAQDYLAKIKKQVLIYDVVDRQLGL